MELPLPDPHPSHVLQRLSESALDEIPQQFPLGGIKKEGETLNAFFGRVAEAFLDEVVPTRDQLFSNVDPMVESLL